MRDYRGEIDIRIEDTAEQLQRELEIRALYSDPEFDEICALMASSDHRLDDADLLREDVEFAFEDEPYEDLRRLTERRFWFD